MLMKNINLLQMDTIRIIGHWIFRIKDRIIEKCCAQAKKIPSLQGDQMQHKAQNPVLPNRAKLPHRNDITSLITVQ